MLADVARRLREGFAAPGDDRGVVPECLDDEMRERRDAPHSEEVKTHGCCHARLPKRQESWPGADTQIVTAQACQASRPGESRAVREVRFCSSSKRRSSAARMKLDLVRVTVSRH